MDQNVERVDIVKDFELFCVNEPCRQLKDVDFTKGKGNFIREDFVLHLVYIVGLVFSNGPDEDPRP